MQLYGQLIDDNVQFGDSISILPILSAKL